MVLNNGENEFLLLNNLNLSLARTFLLGHVKFKVILNVRAGRFDRCRTY